MKKIASNCCRKFSCSIIVVDFEIPYQFYKTVVLKNVLTSLQELIPD